MSEPIIVVCARADAPLAAVGSVFDRQCSRCSAKVMLAPSGQRFLATHADAKIVCEYCVRPKQVLDALAAGKAITAPWEEIAAEARTAQPNLRRNRN